MATEVENLTTIRANYIATLAEESRFQAAHGPKPTYSLDGESVQWDAYRQGMVQKISELTVLIQQIGGPFQVRSRGRA